jgi:uncharacterized caspase-like protein
MNFVRVLLRLVAIVVPSLAAADIASAEPRYALLIGNSRYETLPPLRNPENDVDLVEKSLATAGFKVTKGLNATAEQMQALVKTFIDEIKEVEDPVVLVAFAGHGVAIDDKNYLAGIDAKDDTSENLAASSLDAASVLERVSSAGPRLVMLVLDACREPYNAKTRSLARGLSEMKAADGTSFKNQLIAFSTAPGRLAADGDAGTSPYASAFAESVLIPGLPVEAVFKRIRQKVHERTNGQQEPWENSKLYDDFKFIADGASATLSSEESSIWDFARW